MPRSARLLTFDLLGRAEAVDQMAQVEGAGTDRYHFFFFLVQGSQNVASQHRDPLFI